MPSRRRRRRCWTGRRCGRAHDPRHRQDRRHLLACAASATLRKGKSTTLTFSIIWTACGTEAERRFLDLCQLRRVRHASTAIRATSRAMPARWNGSTRGPGRSSRGCGPAIWRSSPPTTATTRPGAAPTTRASGCRCCGPGVRRGAPSGCVAFADVGATHRGASGRCRPQGPGRSFL